MSDAAVKVQSLSKKYVISHQSSRGYVSLRDKLTLKAQAFKHRLLQLNGDHRKSPQHEEFWALNNVSLEVQRGEIIGIIGRNGAGKSTLLKILSRITEPTTGRIEIDGRVASLLQVGTGFHPELSGRENIYLNGAVLGMTRAEINRKFDEIVAFAETEQFLDTPVKRYSSGMYVRLAFAVAAHLEPEILIVDEVLAVGDVAFQKKCLGKMEDVSSKEGRTVLFVSHNMETVQSLCQRAYLLDQGEIIFQGSTHDTVGQYLQAARNLMQADTAVLEHRQDRRGDGSAKIISLTVENADGGGVILANSRLKLTLVYRSAKPIKNPQFSATIYDYNKGVGLFTVYSGIVGGLPETIPSEGKVTCITEPLYLTPGRCYINLSLYRAAGKIRADHIKYAVYFDIERNDIFGNGILPDRDWVVGLRNFEWEIQES